MGGLPILATLLEPGFHRLAYILYSADTGVEGSLHSSPCAEEVDACHVITRRRAKDQNSDNSRYTPFHPSQKVVSWCGVKGQASRLRALLAVHTGGPPDGGAWNGFSVKESARFIVWAA